MVFLVFCFRFGFCVNTWLYLWGWFFQVYLWLDKYIVEGCMFTFDLTSICTWELHVPVSCQLELMKLVICTCVYINTFGKNVPILVWDFCMYLWFDKIKLTKYDFYLCVYLWSYLCMLRLTCIYILLWRVLASSPSVLLVDFCLCVLPHGSIGCFGARKAEARQRW